MTKKEDIAYGAIGFVLNTLILYVICALILWNPNPFKWIISTTIFGKLSFGVFFIVNFYANFIQKIDNN